MIKNMKDAIIDLPKGMHITKQRPDIEVIIKQGGKVIYHNKTYAVVMNMVQSEITGREFENDVELEGDSQVFGAGPAVTQMFAINELRRKMKKIYIQAIMDINGVIKGEGLKKKNAETLKKLVEEGMEL